MTVLIVIMNNRVTGTIDVTWTIGHRDNKKMTHYESVYSTESENNKVLG